MSTNLSSLTSKSNAKSAGINLSSPQANNFTSPIETLMNPGVAPSADQSARRFQGVITVGKFQNFEQFLALFPKQPRKSIKGGFNVICPAHNDTIPSLSVTLEGHRILLDDKGGCETEDVVRALKIGMADLFLNGSQHPPKGNPTAEHIYQNPDGSPRYIIKRFTNLPDGTKVFEAWLPNATEAGIGDTPKILYRVPKVIKAKTTGEPIHILEGEKDADSLDSEGLVATTAPFGVNSKWLPEYTDLLKGANVVVIPDTDQPGLKRGDEICLALQGKVASLKLLILQGKKDITEWLEAGGTIEGLKKFIDETPEYGKLPKPEITSLGDVYELVWKGEHIRAGIKNVMEHSNGLSGELVLTDTATAKTLSLGRLNFLSDITKDKLIKRLKGNSPLDWEGIIGTISETVIFRHRSGNEALRKADLPEIVDDPYRVYPIILEGQPTIYYGFGGSLKSYHTMLIALLTQNGITFLGLDPKQGNCLWLDFENDDQTYSRRMTAVQEGLGGAELDFPLYKDCRGKTLTQLLLEIQKLVLENDIKLVVVDSMTMAAGGYEWEQSIAYFKALATLKASTVTVDHRAKGIDKGSSPIGAVVKGNIARIVFEVTKGEPVEGSSGVDLAVKNKKNNDNAPLPLEGYRIEFDNGGGRVTHKVTFTKQDPRTVDNIISERKETTKEKLLRYFKTHNNQPETPTSLCVSIGGDVGAIKVALGRGEGDVFVNVDGGTWKMKDSVYSVALTLDNE